MPKCGVVTSTSSVMRIFVGQLDDPDVQSPQSLVTLRPTNARAFKTSLLKDIYRVELEDQFSIMMWVLYLDP